MQQVHSRYRNQHEAHLSAVTLLLRRPVLRGAATSPGCQCRHMQYTSGRCGGQANASPALVPLHAGIATSSVQFKAHRQHHEALDAAWLLPGR